MRPFAKRLFIRPTCEIRVTFLVTLHLHEVQCPHEILVLSPDYRFVGIQFPPDDATKIWRYPVKTHPPTPTYTIEWKREGSIRIIIHSVDEGLRRLDYPRSALHHQIDGGRQRQRIERRVGVLVIKIFLSDKNNISDSVGIGVGGRWFLLGTLLPATGANGKWVCFYM